MPEPIRSPKQSKIAAKARSNPYPLPQRQKFRQDLTAVESITRQSSSLLGAIKSLVTAPLSWLSTVERHPDDHEFVQKRKDPLFERSGTPPSSKRVRRDSPDAEDQAPPHRKLITPLWDLGNGVPPVRHQKIDSREEDPFFRAPSSPSVLYDRTSQSVEPLDFKFSNIHLRRSITRERSLPPPSPFARNFSRVSLTPQPSGATFGPSPKRKQRDLTAPPSNSLPSVPPIPVFTRPPSVPPSLLFPKSPVRHMSEGPIMSLLTKSRQSLSPAREASSMLVGSDTLRSVSPSKAERTFSTLETFRTPLTRFPSQTYPEDRRPRKVHVPLPSKQSFADEFRKKKLPSVSPYPTETSGLRKLLQRNKSGNDLQGLPEENAIEVNAKDTKSVGTSKGEAEVDSNDVSENVPVRTESTSHSTKSDSYSSLRAPTMKLRRTHISAPQLKKPRNKFSLKEDDADETVLSVSDLKTYESKMPKPQLTFSRRMSEAGMQTDASTSTNESSVTTVSSSVPPQPRSFNELLSQIDSSVISKPDIIVDIHPKERDLPPATESSVRPIADLASAKNVSSDLPFSLTPDGSTSHRSLVTPNDFMPSKPLASTSSSNIAVPAVEPAAGPHSVPLFFSSAKTDFTLPPLPTNSIFTSTPSTSQTNGVSEKPANLNNGVPPSPKAPAASEQLMPSGSTKVDNSSTTLRGESLSREDKISTTAPFGSTPVAGTEKSVKVDEGNSIPFAVSSSITHDLPPTHPLTPVESSSNSFSFALGSDMTRKLNVITPPAAPSFTFGSAPTTETAEFTFGDSPAEGTPKPPVNIFKFESSASSGPTVGSETQTSLALPTDHLFIVDTQMDTNDQMEESPRREQEKKAPTTFTFGNSMSDSAFSFGNSAPKSSTTPFTFGGTGNGSIGHSDSMSTGAFSFGNSKPASAGSSFGFTSANSITGSSGFNFSSQPPGSPSLNAFGTTLMTSASAPAFTFGNSPFGGPPKADQPVPTVGGSVPNSPALFPQQNVTPSPSFSFSIPASPATFAKPDSTNPPSSPIQPFQFGASSSSGSQQPGAIFTLGAATNTPPRKLKGLPQRRRK